MDGQIKKTRRHYPRQMMIQVAMEVITGIKGPAEASRDYNVHMGNVIRWVKRYRSEVMQRQTQEALTLSGMRETKSNKKGTELDKQIQSLE
jgi:transposase-like protein